jgi:integrase
MVLLATLTSLRFAEMEGLQWADLDMERGVVHVRRQTIQTKAGKILVTDPKSDAGRRRVTVPPFMVDEIRDHLDRWVRPAKSAWVFGANRCAADAEQPSHDLVEGPGDRGRHRADGPEGEPQRGGTTPEMAGE